MDLNDPVLIHWVDPDRVARLEIAAMLGLVKRRFWPDDNYTR